MRSSPLTARLAVCCLLLSLGACGFHLRGSIGASMPEWLQRLRVSMEDSKLTNEPLLQLMRNALQTDPNITVTDALDAPALLLSGEQTDVRVISVNQGGRASGYTMKYDVYFRVVDAQGKELYPSQGVRLLRDYTFDPVNVLAKEREEQDLKRTLQRDAVQQIIRRLARHVPPEKPLPDANRP
jgi:LPS-assembly lipoprotein